VTKRSVAVIGLGGMGSGLAHALLDAGFPVTVFNRTAAKAEPLVRAGARLATSAAAAGEGADVVVLSLADEPAVEQVLFGEMVWRLRPDTTVVDTSTVSPSFAHNTAIRLTASGHRRVEACVLGNPQMARAGQLRVFAAGEESDVDSARDVLAALGQEVRYLGAAGRASALKLAFNLLLGIQTAGLAEAVAFAEAAGLDRELLLSAVDSSGWRSPVLAFRAEFMRRRAYRPAGFRTELMRKDLHLAQEEAAARGVRLPLVERAESRFASVVSAGRGDEDAAVVVEVRPDVAGARP
jgi:3-hydroxyisobutyrate dehydrogenase-like beta-hydroxyacid dehydrogenase